MKCNSPLHEPGISIDDSPVFDEIFHKGCRHPDVFRITTFVFLSDWRNTEKSNRYTQRGRPTNTLLLARDTILFISRMKLIGVHSRNTARHQAPRFSSNIETNRSIQRTVGTWNKLIDRGKNFVSDVGNGITEVSRHLVLHYGNMVGIIMRIRPEGVLRSNELF